jgi:hypothetical protein
MESFPAWPSQDQSQKWSPLEIAEDMLKNIDPFADPAKKTSMMELESALSKSSKDKKTKSQFGKDKKSKAADKKTSAIDPDASSSSNNDAAASSSSNNDFGGDFAANVDIGDNNNNANNDTSNEEKISVASLNAHDMLCCVSKSADVDALLQFLYQQPG